MPLPRILSLSLAVALCVPAPAAGQSDWDVTRPRGTTRTISFTTSEGTWMSVDPSPDGRWIVFDLLGHIYRVPAGGGDAEVLTQNSGIAMNYHPRWSPDGRTIAFVSDRAGQDNLWLMDADGSRPRPVFLDTDSRAAEPAWHPGGDSIFITRKRKSPSGFYRTNDEIWIYPAAGGEGRLVVALQASGSSAPARAGVWSGQDRVQWASPAEGGNVIYFHSSLFAGTDRHLRRLDRRTGRIDDVTPSTSRYLACCGRPAYPLRLGEVAPEISPDGRWLAFVRKIPGATVRIGTRDYTGRTALWLRNLETGAERVLMDPITADAMEMHPAWDHRVLPGYSWARDGRSIVISEGGRIRRVSVPDGWIETIPFTAKVERVISEMARARARIEDDSLTVRLIRHAAPSPDGRTAAFDAVGRIWLAPLGGGRPRELVAGALEGLASMPAWSPDGRFVAFVTWSDSAGGHLWRAPAAGGAAERLTAVGTRFVHPWWSADGRYLHASRWDPALTYVPSGWVWLVVRVAAGGGEMEILRPAGPMVRSNAATAGWAWRLQGDRLVAARAAPADPWTHPAIAGAPVEVAPAPDGRAVALVLHHDVHVARLAAAPRDSASIPTSDLVRLSREGGRDPRWLSATRLGFTSGNRYLVHDLATGRTDTSAIRLTVPRDRARGSIALTGARIIADGGERILDQPSSRFRVIPRGTIVIRDGRIRCVGDCDTASVDRAIPLDGATVIPGLIDTHAHHLTEDVPGPIPERRHTSARYLAWGVTTTHDPSADLDQSFEIGELIEAGRMIGPRTYSTGVALTCSDFDDLREIDTRADARDHVRRAVMLGALSIKDYKQCTRVQRQMLQDVGRELGVTLTSEGSDPFYLLGLMMGGAAGWEHAIQYLPMYGDMTRFLGRAGAHYSGQLLLSDYPHGNALEYWLGREDLWRNPKVMRWSPWQEIATRRSFVAKPPAEFAFPVLADGAAAIKRAGGYLPTGAHGEQDGLGTHWEMWTMAFGLTPLEALETATWDAAHFLGLERDLGSIAVGKVADLVVLNADPLERIENTADIRYVVKSGRVYDADDLSEVWPTARPFGIRWWNPPVMERR